MSTQKVFCPHCGQQLELELDYQASFCPYCGQKVSVPAQPPKAETAAWQEIPPAPVAPRFEEPVLEQKDPFPSGQSASAPASRQSGKQPSLARWYIAVILWALAFGVAYYFAEDLNILFQPGVLFPLLFLASFPLWYPIFHPWRKIPEKSKGVWLRWSIIMLAILALIFFLVEEVF